MRTLETGLSGKDEDDDAPRSRKRPGRSDLSEQRLLRSKSDHLRLRLGLPRSFDSFPSYVLPSEDHTIQKLLLLYLEIIDKTDACGRVLLEIILICQNLHNNLQHPNEYIRSVTLRFLCHLSKAEILEPLIPSVLSNLEHRHPFSHSPPSPPSPWLETLAVANCPDVASFDDEPPLSSRSSAPSTRQLRPLRQLPSPQALLWQAQGHPQPLLHAHRSPDGSACRSIHLPGELRRPSPFDVVASSLPPATTRRRMSVVQRSAPGSAWGSRAKKNKKKKEKQRKKRREEKSEEEKKEKEKEKKKR